MMKTEKPLTHGLLDLFATKQSGDKKICFIETTSTQTPNIKTHHIYSVSAATIASLPLKERQAYLNFLQAKESHFSELICPLPTISSGYRNKPSC